MNHEKENKESIVSLNHIIAAQIIISSVLLEENFFEPLQLYRVSGPEAIEEFLGEFLLPFSVEMELIEEVADYVFADDFCQSRLIFDLIEIDDDYVRRRFFRIAEFLIQASDLVEEVVKELDASKDIETLFKDKTFKDEFFTDQEYFDNKEELKDLLDLEYKKEEKLLN